MKALAVNIPGGTRAVGPDVVLNPDEFLEFFGHLPLESLVGLL